MPKKIPPQSVAAPGRVERAHRPEDSGPPEPLSGSKKVKNRNHSRANKGGQGMI